MGKIASFVEVATRSDPKQRKRSKKAKVNLRTQPSFDPLTMPELFHKNDSVYLGRKDTLKDDFSFAMLKSGL